MTGNTRIAVPALCLVFLFAVAANTSCQRTQENSPMNPGTHASVSAFLLALMSAATAAADTSAVARAGHAARPPRTQDVSGFPENTIYLWWDAGFGGKKHQIHPVTRMPVGRPRNFPDQHFLQNIRDDMSSLQWNLPPGVVVVFYEDSADEGEQFVIWGKGQIRELLSRDFNDKVSRWAWYYVGGADDLAASQVTIPVGANGFSSPLQDSLQLWKHTDYRGKIGPVTSVTGYGPGEYHRLPEGLGDDVSSVRWDLPPGVVVVLYQHAKGTGRHVAVWSRGEFPRLSRWDINDKVSSWAWFFVGDPDHARPVASVTSRSQFCTGCGGIRPAGQAWRFCPSCGCKWHGEGS